MQCVSGISLILGLEGWGAVASFLCTDPMRLQLEKLGNFKALCKYEMEWLSSLFWWACGLLLSLLSALRVSFFALLSSCFAWTKA